MNPYTIICFVFVQPLDTAIATQGIAGGVAKANADIIPMFTISAATFTVVIFAVTAKAAADTTVAVTILLDKFV